MSELKLAVKWTKPFEYGFRKGLELFGFTPAQIDAKVKEAKAKNKTVKK